LIDVSLFYVLVVLASVLIAFFVFYFWYQKKRVKMEKYFVRNPDRLYMYFNQKSDALKFYKKLLKGGKDAQMKKVSLSVLPFFGKEVQIEETLEKRDLNSDKYLMGKNKIKKEEDN